MHGIVIIIINVGGEPLCYMLIIEIIVYLYFDVYKSCIPITSTLILIISIGNSEVVC